MNPKALVQSWTFWFGALQLLLGGVGWASGLMDPTSAVTLITTGVGTIGLRLKTDSPITSIVPPTS